MVHHVSGGVQVPAKQATVPHADAVMVGTSTPGTGHAAVCSDTLDVLARTLALAQPWVFSHRKLSMPAVVAVATPRGHVLSPALAVLSRLGLVSFGVFYRTIRELVLVLVGILTA